MEETSGSISTGANGPSPPTAAHRPLQLGTDTQPFFDEMLRLLDARTIKHARIAYAFLFAILVAVVLAIALIALARSILGGDLEKARRNEELVNELKVQKNELQKEEEVLNARTKSVREDFLKQFGSGQSWIQAALPRDFNSRLSWVDVRGTQGFAVGAQILYTTDGGQNWSAAAVRHAGQKEPEDPFEASDAGFALGGYQSPLLGWVVGKRGKIARSTDGGRNWLVSTAHEGSGDPGLVGGVASSTFNYVFFKNFKDGWAVGDDGLIAETQDGGETWITRAQGLTKARLYYARMYADDVGIAVGADLTLLTSADGGAHWQNDSEKISALLGGKSQNINLLAMDLQLSNNLSITKRVILVGSNGLVIFGDRQGRSFEWKLGALLNDSGAGTTPLRGDIERIGSLRWVDRFGATNAAIAVGDRGTILISNDLGETWQSVPAATTTSINFAQSIAHDRAIVVGEKNWIAQVQLNVAAKQATVSPDPIPHSNGSLRWLSSGDQTVAVGQAMIVRRVTFSKALAPLQTSEGEDFRRIVANSTLQQEALNAIPENSILWHTLKEVIAEIGRINDRVKAVREKIQTINERIETNLNREAISSQEFMWWLNGARALVVLIAFFLIKFLSSLYRYNSSLVAYYEARGDALRMLRVLPNTMNELTAIFAPRPLEDVGAGNVVEELVSTAKGIIGMQPKP